MIVTLEQWLDCKTPDGKPLPTWKCNRYRLRHDLPPLDAAAVGGSSPKPRQPKIRGLGDVVAAVTKATGIERVVEAVSKKTGIPCGCKKRREALNKLVPFGSNASE